MDILKNKAYKQYDNMSRYAIFPYFYHSRDEKYVYGTTAYLKDTTPYSLYTVKKFDTLDSIAFEFYNNPTLYWVICSFNHIQDPFIELKEGQKLKIPSMSSIEYDY